MRVRLAVAAVALACALAAPVLSADVWAYAAYGALLLHGADPWAHAYRAADVAPFADPLLGAALRAWDGSIPRDVYGPLFTAPVAAIVAAARPFGAAGAVVALRWLAAATLLACIALAARVRPRLATLLAFHPVVLWSAAEGHNDVFWLALVLAADRARRGRTRIAVLAAASALKGIAVVPLAGALAALPRARRAFSAAATIAALLFAYLPLIRGVLLHGVDRAVSAPRISLLHAGALAAWSNSPLPLAIGFGLAAIALAAAILSVRRGDTLAGLALAGWAALPAPEPWYALWLLPVVAIAGRTRASQALLVASVTGAAGYLQDQVAATTLRDPAFLGGMMLALYALPLLIALVHPAPSPQPNSPPAAAPQNSPVPQPAPTATTTPVPPGSTPSPVPSPNPYAYVVAPPPASAAAPHILEIALNDRTLHSGKLLLVRVTTSPDVTTVVARTLGHEIAVPLTGPGLFAGQQQVPTGIPFFLLNRDYQVEFVATTADGHSATYTLPVRLER